MVLPYLSGSFAALNQENSVQCTVGKNFLGYGVRFGLRANDEQELEQLLGVVPLGWEEIPDGQVDVLYSLQRAASQDVDVNKDYLLYADSELIARDSNIFVVIKKFGEHARLHTALYAKERLFVHAGVVGWKGQAILIPGRSLSGKTTLVQALVNAGAAYYSDEFAVLDRDGYTHPYPLPLSIRTADGTVIRTPITALGGQIGTAPLPVKLVVMTRYAEGAQWEPQTLLPSLAMLALMDNTVAARRDPYFSMPVLRATALRASAVTSTRGDAESIAPHILNLLSAE